MQGGMVGSARNNKELQEKSSEQEDKVNLQDLRGFAMCLCPRKKSGCIFLIN